MKHKFPTALLIFSAVLFGAYVHEDPSAAQTPSTGRIAPFTFRSMPNSAFDVGERLTFDLAWEGVSGGQATMSIPDIRYINGRKTFETRVDANSN